MKIILNGKEKEVADSTTLQLLLQAMQLHPEMVACELNLNIIKRNKYGSTQLGEGDCVEILQMIGGG